MAGARSFKSGGRVMKNVTGYDLGSAMAGSWGTLAIMTEVAIKVLPCAGGDPHAFSASACPTRRRSRRCASPIGTPFEVSGTVHIHAELAKRFTDEGISGAGTSVTAIRVENLPASARYRANRLRQMLASLWARARARNGAEPALLERDADLRMFQKSDRPLWRISTAPSKAPKLVASIARKIEVRPVYDWSGGLIWLETPPLSDAGAVEIRRTLAEFGGHATLIRADDAGEGGDRRVPAARSPARRADSAGEAGLRS